MGRPRKPKERIKPEDISEENKLYEYWIDEKKYLVSSIDYEGCMIKKFGHSVVNMKKLFEEYGFGNGVGFKLMTDNLECLFDDENSERRNTIGIYDTLDEALRVAAERQYSGKNSFRHDK